MREVTIISILQEFDQKNRFFGGLPWLRVNNLGLALGMNLKFYTSMAKGLKLKARKFWRLFSKFAEVPEEKLIGDLFALSPS